MCGICGIWTGAEPAEEAVRRMVGALGHRGPDGSGLWSDPAAGLTLGHARLAILDRSPLGHQPMLSASGRLVLSYNGEIYNFRALRAELEAMGDVFRGHSDSEVLLAAIERWGLAAALGRAEGMFALALWDRAARTLSLARDRAGKKPLYYGRTAAGFLLASELKALAERRGVLSHLTFLGRTSEPHRLLRAADLFLLTSRWEALPFTIVEAFQAGVPAVATACSGVVELIDDEVGRVVPVGDVTAICAAVEDVLADEGRRQAMAAAALARSTEDRFNPDWVHPQFEALYRSLARGGNG